MDRESKGALVAIRRGGAVAVEGQGATRAGGEGPWSLGGAGVCGAGRGAGGWPRRPADRSETRGSSSRRRRRDTGAAVRHRCARAGRPSGFGQGKRARAPERGADRSQQDLEHRAGDVHVVVEVGTQALSSRRPRSHHLQLNRGQLPSRLDRAVGTAIHQTRG